MKDRKNSYVHIAPTAMIEAGYSRDKPYISGIDTNQSFVICSDTLSNVQANDPNVISTGPAAIDPATGTAYATPNY